MPRSTFLETPLVWQPLGAFYLISRLESLGHGVDFFDLNEDEFPQDGDYEQVWITSTAPQIAEVRRIAEKTKEWKTRTVLGGASVWASPDTYKDMGFTLIVGGECDHPDNTKKIVEAAENPPQYNHLLFPTSKTLDWVLPPSRKWSYKYHAELSDTVGNMHQFTTMFSTRGCPLTCSFCESSRHGVIWDARTRYEPLDVVEHQLREIVGLGYTGVNYYDDVAILNKKRTLAIMEMHKKYGLVWRGFARTDIISNQGGYEYLKQLKEGGLCELFVGVESADNRVKDAIFKKTSIEQDTDVLHWARDLGIRLKCSFILGLPGESRESMEKTREWILRERPDRAQIGRLIPFDGTPLVSRKDEYDLKYEEQPPEEWYYSGSQTHSFVSTSFLSRDEIDEFYHALIAELKAEGIPS
jgi:radical SAM superfamily enzyme YgiQ (UPF0313 family)